MNIPFPIKYILMVDEEAMQFLIFLVLLFVFSNVVPALMSVIFVSMADRKPPGNGAGGMVWKSQYTIGSNYSVQEAVVNWCAIIVFLKDFSRYLHKRQKPYLSSIFHNIFLERSPPIEEVIKAGVVPRFVEFLSRHDLPQLQVFSFFTF